MGSPIRVVFFGGAYLQPGAQHFVALLNAHPEIELVLGLCEGEGAGLLHRWRNLWRRRGLMAFPLLLLEKRGQSPFSRKRGLSPFFVADVHAPAVVAAVRAAEPDLGVVYGGPILKAELFSIPRLGTLGIHHGRVPRYRGKKTTFWEMYHGEPAAGITIQRLNAGIDSGDIVRTGEVAIGRKSYSRVWREVEELGCELFLQAVLEVGRGRAEFRPQDTSQPRPPLFRQPTPRRIFDFWWRRLLGWPPRGGGR